MMTSRRSGLPSSCAAHSLRSPSMRVPSARAKSGTCCLWQRESCNFRNSSKSKQLLGLPASGLKKSSGLFVYVKVIASSPQKNLQCHVAIRVHPENGEHDQLAGRHGKQIEETFRTT